MDFQSIVIDILGQRT